MSGRELAQREAAKIVERVAAINVRRVEIAAAYQALAEEMDRLLAEMRQLNGRLVQLGLAPIRPPVRARQ